MEFEEYRQPWETGPHWELKREFLEFYKDNFAKDRLLCLAQAYSNIELMQCSYPNQVMIQIHELSKPLKANKRFRSSLSTNSEKEKGKRKRDDDSGQKYKFIKFCSSSQDPISPKNENTESFSPVATSDVDFKSIISSKDFEVIEKMALEVRKLPKILNRSKIYNAIVQEAKKLHSKFNSTIVQGCLQTYCELLIGETVIARGNGPCEDTAKVKAAENALHTLSNLYKHLPSNLLKDKEHETETQNKASEANQTISLDPAQNSNGIFPSRTLSTEDLDFLKKFAEKFKKTQRKIPNDLDALCQTSSRLKLKDGVQCNVSTDIDSPKHNRSFTSELFIKNIPVAGGKGSSKKFASLDAARSAIKYLFSLIDCDGTYYFGKTDPNRPRLEIASMFKDQSHIMSQGVSGARTHCESEDALKNVDMIGDAFVDAPKKHFSLNHRLWRNSLNKQFILVDRTGAIDPTFNNPASKLSYSAQQSRKQISFNQEALDGDKWRCEVLIEKDVVGTAFGSSKVEAKTEACSNALETLRKKVYTVKMKMGEEDGFFINRQDMVHLKTNSDGGGSQGPSQVVSESNIGCKMLKMMGWSGGGIGKKEGIIEPISAGVHAFGRGLGFVKNDCDSKMMSLKAKITALLKEYSQSNALVPLVFATDFTKEERKLVHNVASRFKLTSASHGKNEARKVTVKRKISVEELLNLILKSGGSTKKYELIDMSM